MSNLDLITRVMALVSLTSIVFMILQAIGVLVWMWTKESHDYE